MSGGGAAREASGAGPVALPPLADAATHREIMTREAGPAGRCREPAAKDRVRRLRVAVAPAGRPPWRRPPVQVRGASRTRAGDTS